jgi:hypothetical protein
VPSFLLPPFSWLEHSLLLPFFLIGHFRSLRLRVACFFEENLGTVHSALAPCLLLFSDLAMLMACDSVISTFCDSAMLVPCELAISMSYDLAISMSCERKVSDSLSTTTQRRSP